jgi:hypothetical protein
LKVLGTSGTAAASGNTRDFRETCTGDDLADLDLFIENLQQGDRAFQLSAEKRMGRRGEPANENAQACIDLNKPGAWLYGLPSSA